MAAKAKAKSRKRAVSSKKWAVGSEQWAVGEHYAERTVTPDPVTGGSGSRTRLERALVPLLVAADKSAIQTELLETRVAAVPLDVRKGCALPSRVD